MDLLLVFLLLYAAFFGLPTFWLAEQKGRSGSNWFLAGCVFGPAAILILGFAPMGTSGNYKACVECLEPVRVQGTKCPHCGTDLIEEDGTLANA